MKIAVYAISRDEEQFVDRFCASAADADVIIVGDTGSGDGTVERLAKWGAEVYPVAVMPWRFDHARNTVLSLVPADIDVCISLDIDEILTPGWREELERVWMPHTTRLRYGYDWGRNVIFHAEKIHARQGYHWHHPCHEMLRIDPRFEERFATTDTVVIQHLPDQTKSRGQYLSLLKVGVQEDPHCSRNAMYYARELTFAGMWDEAILQLQRYLQLPTSTWDGERGYAMRLIGDGMEVRGRATEALYWYRQATIEAPAWREPFYHLAKALYRRQRWHEALKAAEAALAIEHRPMSYIAEPEAWGAGPWDVAAIASFNLAKYEDAHSYGQTALTHAPDDERLASNCLQYAAMLSKSASFATLPLVSE